jgi:hypothetical protein
MIGDLMAVAIADVSGKRIAAAVMASLLQGMIDEGLRAGVSLVEIARAANEFSALRISDRNTQPLRWSPSAATARWNT